MNTNDLRITPFAKRVYAAVAAIPRGRVSTYRLVAAAVGCGSARAIGQALKRNPFAPRVPCHRVIASGLTLGGFRGKTRGRALGDKMALLAAEGVVFEEGRLKEPRRLFTFAGGRP